MSSQKKWLTLSAAPVEILEKRHFGFLVLMDGGSLLQICKTPVGLNFTKLGCTETIHHMLERECNTKCSMSFDCFGNSSGTDTLIQ